MLIILKPWCPDFWHDSSAQKRSVISRIIIALSHFQLSSYSRISRIQTDLWYWSSNPKITTATGTNILLSSHCNCISTAPQNSFASLTLIKVTYTTRCEIEGCRLNSHLSTFFVKLCQLLLKAEEFLLQCMSSLPSSQTPENKSSTEWTIGSS